MTQPIPALVTIPQAASILGIPAESLRGAAEKHGYIVRMGRAVRLETDRLGELVKKCYPAELRDHIYFTRQRYAATS